MKLPINTGWSRGNACFSYKNKFVYFQHKKVPITQKRRYFNAFLKYVPNYIWKIMSDDVLLARHTFGASPQSPASHAPTFFAAELRFLDERKVSALCDRSGNSKCFNPLEYSFSIWNCTSTLNIELSTEKMLDSNYGITVSKKMLDSKHTMLYIPMHHGY